MPRTISIANQKGGVGKTTTAINLSAALARKGTPVLLIDMDPQGNASSGLGLDKDSVTTGTADVLVGFRDLRSAVLPTADDHLDVLPATRSLVGLEVELVSLPRRELRLHEALQDLPRQYDYVFIDCPPSLNLLTVNALAASDSVLIPLQAEYFAMEGLGELLRTITAARQDLNPRLVREGVLITMSDNRNNLSREVESQARQVFGPDVFGTVIPRNVRLAEAPSFGQSVFHHDQSCRGAQAYAALADELLSRHGSANGSVHREAS